MTSILTDKKNCARSYFNVYHLLYLNEVNIVFLNVFAFVCTFALTTS